MSSKVIFKDRKDAARQLLAFLPLEQMKNEKWEFIGVSRGGLVMASFLAQKIDANVDFLFSEAIYAPQNDECEIARVSETEELVINEALVNSFEIQNDYIYGEATRKHEEQILSCIYQYRKGRHFPDMHKKTVLLLDEGAESGYKLLCALKTILAMNPKAVYMAVPIVPRDLIEVMEPMVDGLIYVSDIIDYVETSCYYDEFENISDEEIEKILGDR